MLEGVVSRYSEDKGFGFISGQNGQEIRANKILDAIRGMEAVDRDRLADMLINVGRIGLENENVKEIDINPVVISGKNPIAVDALLVLE